MYVRERVPCHTTAGVLIVHFVWPSRGQISDVFLTQAMILSVLDMSDACSHAWCSRKLVNLNVLNTPYPPLAN